MLESKIQTKIIKYLESIGYFVIKIMKCNKNGIPDLIAIKDGKAYFIECKRTGITKADPLQEYQMEMLRKSGAVAFVADSLEIVKEKCK